MFVDEHGVCVVRGELDEATGIRLEACLQHHPEVSCVDLGEVSFVDSAGLRCLLLLRQRLIDRGARWSCAAAAARCAASCASPA